MWCKNDFNDWLSGIVIACTITLCSLVGFFLNEKRLQERLKNIEIQEKLKKYRKFLKDGRDKRV